MKLYDRVPAVIAELVSNSYDADATKVTITAPMGEYLATRVGDEIKDRGHAIAVADDGTGMTPDQVNRYYLRVGAERRKDERGDTSKKFSRKVMGNKGVGKLAPFGICQQMPPPALLQQFAHQSRPSRLMTRSDTEPLSPWKYS